MDMTNLISTANYDYIKGTLEHMKTNVNFNLEKVKQAVDLLNKAANGVITPITKIKSHYLKQIKEYKIKYEGFISNLEKKQQMVEDQKKSNKDEIPTLHSFIEEYQINSSISNDHIELAKKLDKMMSIVTLFNNLFNSEEFDRLITQFNEVEYEGGNININDNIINAMLRDEDTQSIESQKEQIDKKKNKKFLKKRKRDELNNIGDKNKSKSKLNKKNIKNGKKSNLSDDDAIVDLNKPLPKKSWKRKNSDSKENESDCEDGGKSKKRFSDEECTEKMKEAFPDYKGITKTFLTRKLLKNVIWSSEYDYTSDDLEKNHREVVKSATYKFIKLFITTSDTKNCNLHSDFLNYLKELLKNSTCQFKENTIIIAGEMEVDLEVFVEKIKNQEIHDKFHVNYIKATVHAFLEELLSEFDTSDSNTYSTFSDDELQKFASEYEKIQKLRKYWKELKLIK